MGGNCAQKVHHISLITTNLMYIVHCSGGIRLSCRNVFITTKYQLKCRTLENQYLKSSTDAVLQTLADMFWVQSYRTNSVPFSGGRKGGCARTIEHRTDYWWVTSCRLRKESFAAMYQPTQWYALLWHLIQSCFSVKIFIADLKGTGSQIIIKFFFYKNG